MNVRSITNIGEHHSRFAVALILIAALSVSGCCSFCGGTICDTGTMIDPDGGGEIVDRDDGVQEVRGGSCIPGRGTICDKGTMIDPDGGGEIVDRDDGVQEVRGGRCILPT